MVCTHVETMDLGTQPDTLEGCCDSSPRRHATAHFHRTEHPVVRSFEPGEAWVWCYVDEQLVETGS